MDTVQYMTASEIDTIGEMLEELYPEGMTQTDVNDFFWFERDTIAEWLGFDSWEAYMSSDDGSGDEDEDE